MLMTTKNSFIDEYHSGPVRLALNDIPRHIKCTSIQKQRLIFSSSSDFADVEKFSCDISITVPIGRLLIDRDVEISPNIFEQIMDLDYYFLRLTQYSDTLVLLPSDTDDIRFTVSTNDHGKTWSLDRLILN